MGERKGTNKYYPPDFDPGKGSLNAYHGTHALRERARKIHEGIIIIRFEMPYNIWCNGCGNHVGMGVRYNAQKRKVGNYYTTPIYKFRMKCHLCDQHFEIQTDPKNCDYVILSGAKRKEERWDPSVTENIQTTDRDVKAKLISDAMFKLEHSIEDKQKAKRAAPTINQIKNIRDEWEDDYAISQVLRKKFREEKREISRKKVLDDEFKERNSLPSSMELTEINDEDINLAKRMRFGEDLRPDLRRKRRQQDIKHSSIFEKQTDSKAKLAVHLVGMAKKRHSTIGNIGSNSFEKIETNAIVGKKKEKQVDDKIEIEGQANSEGQTEIEGQAHVKIQKYVRTQANVIAEANETARGDNSEQSMTNHHEDTFKASTEKSCLEEVGDSTNAIFEIRRNAKSLNSSSERLLDASKPLVAEYGSSSDETDENFGS